MKRTIAALAAVFVAALLGGCSKDAEFNEFIDLQGKVSADIVKAFEGSKDPVEGAAAAQKVLDAKKAELTTKFAVIKEARGFQVKEETQKKAGEAVGKSVMAVCGLQMKAIMNANASAPLKKLCDDFTATIGGN